MNVREWVSNLRIALGDRQIAYRRTFSAPPAELVLKDLARFCRAHESTMHADERVQANLEGRREVWLRIQEHLRMDSETLWRLYSGRGSSADE